jgi:hypothetical protein
MRWLACELGASVPCRHAPSTHSQQPRRLVQLRKWSLTAQPRVDSSQFDDVEFEFAICFRQKRSLPRLDHPVARQIVARQSQCMHRMVPLQRRRCYTSALRIELVVCAFERARAQLSNSLPHALDKLLLRQPTVPPHRDHLKHNSCK